MHTIRVLNSAPPFHIYIYTLSLEPSFTSKSKLQNVLTNAIANSVTSLYYLSSDSNAFPAATVWLCKTISRKSSQSLKFLAGSKADALLSNTFSWYKVPFSTAEVALYSCFQIACNINVYNTWYIQMHNFICESKTPWVLKKVQGWSEAAV